LSKGKTERREKKKGTVPQGKKVELTFTWWSPKGRVRGRKEHRNARLKKKEKVQVIALAEERASVNQDGNRRGKEGYKSFTARTTGEVCLQSNFAKKLCLIGGSKAE